MKQYKKVIAAVAAAAILALPLSGCSFNDVMLYLYGGDSFTKEEGEDYQTYDGENGISVTYDANIWNGTQHVAGGYHWHYHWQQAELYGSTAAGIGCLHGHFWKNPPRKLNEEAQTVRYDFDLTIPMQKPSPSGMTAALTR